MPFDRAAGVLLHPTSLPGPGGIGTIGAEARRFVDFLAEAGYSIWQVLPLGPTGYGDSPYQAFSAFAGNPLLIDLGSLRDEGLLPADDPGLEGVGSDSAVEFGVVIPTKMGILHRASEKFSRRRKPAGFEEFLQANAGWLDDFALFMALKDAHGGAPWNEWEIDLRLRQPSAVESARRRLATGIHFHLFLQYEFFRQWRRLKDYAGSKRVRIMGDIPIFVAYDSADVWARQDLFRLDPEGVPEVVAGVPPDYFSATGQLWGNPHYRWDVMAQEDFGWWVERFRLLLQLVDIVRLDHFRGFAAAWAVPWGEATAERGTWMPSPGAELFDAVSSALGTLPIVAEDLGVITPDVVELRRRYGFPGMYILQFAFSSGPDDPSLPHNIDRNSVVYTGTHDNDTTVGWFWSVDESERDFVRRYTGTAGIDVSWDLIKLAMASAADMAIVPLQDVLRLGTTARMNLPARASGNWSWRFRHGDVNRSHVEGLRSLAETYGRLGPRPASQA